MAPIILSPPYSYKIREQRGEENSYFEYGDKCFAHNDRDFLVAHYARKTI